MLQSPHPYTLKAHQIIRSPLHARNNGNRDNGDDDNDGENININKSSQTLFSEGRKDDQTYCKSCKTNVDNQSLRATTVLKQSINTIQTSIKERSETFERKVAVILTKVEENERMLQMKFPWLQTVMSSVNCSFNSTHSSSGIWSCKTSN